VVVGGGGGGALVAGYDGLDYDGYAAMQGRHYVGEWLLTLTLTRVRRAAVAVLLQVAVESVASVVVRAVAEGVKERVVVLVVEVRKAVTVAGARVAVTVGEGGGDGGRGGRRR
jgi:hypothetical protein